ncbi:MAG: TRAP transporter substrate-binding protein [Pseudomonadota bacterium]
MDRRSFLRAGAVGTTAVAASTLAAPAIAQGVQELKMVTSWPKNFPGLGTSANRVAERIEAMSDGRFKVRVFGGGELVPALKTQDALQEGTADLYHSADYYFVGKTPSLAYFSAVPFGLTANEQNAWLYHGGGQEIWDEIAAEFNVKPFAAANTGVQMGGWFKNPITTIDDFKGLKMRIPGLGGDVVNALGGTSVTLAGAEIQPALQAGTIDATEWVGPWNDLAFGLYKVVKNYGYPGFHEPGTTLSAGVRKDLWDGLSDSDKAMMDAAITAENCNGLAEFNANNGTALNQLINDHGVNLFEIPDDVYTAIGEASRDVLAGTASSDAMTQKTYDSFMAFRKNAVEWTRLSDQSYANKRSLVDFG